MRTIDLSGDWSVSPEAMDCIGESGLHRVLQAQDGWLDARVPGDVTSPVYCHAVHVEDHGRDVVSDNWFDLLPGVPARVRVATGTEPDGLTFRAVGRAAHAL